MQEINETPWNGYKVVSTFSGCGGSCLGYRMAGYKVVWANEINSHAQATYLANKADDSYLDLRDIRDVKATEILETTGLKEGELDLFDGSPPCQAFSTVGQMAKHWHKEKDYGGEPQRNVTMFEEHLRLLRGLMPKTFIAENVSGLYKGVNKGMFFEILANLKASGYKVTCKLLDASWLGVPQKRERTIFMGVREDLGIAPVFPSPLPHRYTVANALPWIQEITTSGVSRGFTMAELKRLCSFPDDFKLLGGKVASWKVLGNSVPPVMMYHVASAVRDKVLNEIK